MTLKKLLIMCIKIPQNISTSTGIMYLSWNDIQILSFYLDSLYHFQSYLGFLEFFELCKAPVLVFVKFDINSTLIYDIVLPVLSYDDIFKTSKTTCLLDTLF